MIGISEFITEKKYDYHCVISPFYMQMIRIALESYKNSNREENYTDKDIDTCLDILGKSKIE